MRAELSTCMGMEKIEGITFVYRRFGVLGIVHCNIIKGPYYCHSLIAFELHSLVLYLLGVGVGRAELGRQAGRY